MWQFKEFKTRQAMQKWLDKNESKIQWQEIFINNGYCVEWRKLRIINVG